MAGSPQDSQRADPAEALNALAEAAVQAEVALGSVPSQDPFARFEAILKLEAALNQVQALMPLVPAMLDGSRASESLQTRVRLLAEDLDSQIADLSALRPAMNDLRDQAAEVESLQAEKTWLEQRLTSLDSAQGLAEDVAALRKQVLELEAKLPAPVQEALDYQQRLKAACSAGRTLAESLVAKLDPEVQETWKWLQRALDGVEEKHSELEGLIRRTNEARESLAEANAVLRSWHEVDVRIARESRAGGGVDGLSGILDNAQHLLQSADELLKAHIAESERASVALHERVTLKEGV